MKVSPSDSLVFRRCVHAAAFAVLKVMCQRISWGKETLSVFFCAGPSIGCAICLDSLQAGALYSLGVDPTEAEKIQLGQEVKLQTFVQVRRAVSDWVLGKMRGADLQ